ncbi:MAG TPA: glycosyltransferase family 2 protein, partial [bacterium]|nr:glycosyltransferase family 2 protein [bacterium]
SRASLASLWKQYFQYGFWKVRVMQKHPRQMQWRQFVPPLFVFSLPTSFLGGFFIPVSMALFFFILKLYLAVDLAASFSTSFKKGWKHFPLLLIIYPVLHLSYGFGFLTGLVCFWNRRDRL